MSDCSGTFESCQAELIDLQTQFKRDMLSLSDVETKFEAWKRRHAANSLGRAKRAEELDNMLDQIGEARGVRSSESLIHLATKLDRSGQAM